MPSYDTLFGVNNFSDYTIPEIISASYITHIDWGFLNIGAFTNISLANSNIYNANLSKLRLSNDVDYSKGQVWETFHNNLVWESGISIATQPTLISGVYVNNTFYPKDTTGAYKHHVEYTTGRVIFDSAISTTSTVKMEYAYKLISVTEAKNYPALREIQFRSFDPLSNNFNQLSSGDYAKSPNIRNQLPLIGIEVTPKQNSLPYELGNKVKKMQTSIIFHVLGEDDNMVKKIISIISLQKESTIFLLDLTSIAKSGIFPLDENGALNNNPLTYPDIISHNEYRFAKSYMLDAVASDGKWVSNNLYHGAVRSVIETIY